MAPLDRAAISHSIIWILFLFLFFWERGDCDVLKVIGSSDKSKSFVVFQIPRLYMRYYS